MYIADLHIHSKYSRATSRECVPEHLDLWARRKGIDILGTGDFTHPAWRQELKEKLAPAEEGLYVLKEEFRIRDSLTSDQQPRFVISGEISSIYKKNEKTRKVHNLILLPGLQEAELLSRKLEAIGNVHSDGRPILGLDSRDLLEITLESCPKAIFIPAHIWTPHFSLFGAFSGFNTIEECFEDLTSHIRALETGLSSDPPMNWRLSALDSYNLVSNSDAHSPGKLGREANLLDIPLSYDGLYDALQKGKGLSGTIEFFPEEGKYHMDGHRKCDLCLSPVETKEYGGKCPVCGKKITIGVLHRVEELADREEGYERPGAGIFENLVPLQEVIAASTDKSAASVKVQRQYEAMLKELGPEFSILRDISLEAIGSCAGPCIKEGIHRLRQGKVERIPGFDGEYGKIKIIGREEIEELCGQLSLFESVALPAAKKKKVKPKLEAATEFAVEEPIKSQGLNAQQLEAITAEEKTVVVIAGPGTGKTRTLTERISYLIQEKNVKAADITAVTFTNKAAAEMRERLVKLLGKKTAKSVTIGTFHAICLNLLKEWMEDIVLADEHEQISLAEIVVKQYEVPLAPNKFLREVSRYKSGNILGNEANTEAIQFYNQCLRDRGILDFDDLLLETLRHMEQNPEAGSFGNKSWLLVDELQDINEIQYQLIRAWSSHGSGLFVIGDPDQSIYGFRGADGYSFERVCADYPEVRQIRLLKNYRSTPEIIRCAVPVISKNKGPERILDACRRPGEKVRLLTAESQLSEAIFVAREINYMTGGMDMMDAQNYAVKRNAHRSFSDIAVLYRTHHQAKVLEKCLQKESIPCVITGKDDFLQDRIVRGTIAFFRTLLDFGKDEERLAAAGELIFDTDPLETSKYLAETFLLLLKEKKASELLKIWAEKAGLKKCKPLRKLTEMAMFYDSIGAFLDNLLLGEEQDLKRTASGKLYDSGAVTLMTLHASKGLEFPAVFLCGVNEDCVPMKDADLEEERRLFYVGMTRAEEELIMITSAQPSMFLADIPTELLESGEVYKKKIEVTSEQLNLFDL